MKTWWILLQFWLKQDIFEDKTKDLYLKFSAILELERYVYDNLEN